MSGSTLSVCDSQGQPQAILTKNQRVRVGFDLPDPTPVPSLFVALLKTNAGIHEVQRIQGVGHHTRCVTYLWKCAFKTYSVTHGYFFASRWSSCEVTFSFCFFLVHLYF
ncbi:hypothetical protein CRENBAI_009497 [Crenichthys baileyi]|uniref:Uncharacterized protein n=1 Tax=Crenichthys baileyi TaxID=28760 RepID=A0AAV9SLK8_9TELE